MARTIAGTLRDPNDVNRQWRMVRDERFRKSLATLIDEGLSARIGTDHLGLTNVSMTQGAMGAELRSRV